MQNGKAGLDKARAKSHGEVESLSVANYVLCDQCELCVYAVAINYPNQCRFLRVGWKSVPVQCARLPRLLRGIDR